MSTTKPSGSRSANSSGSEDKEFTVIIGEGGRLSFVHDDDLHGLLSAAFPQLETERASHVEPDGSGGWKVDVAPIWNRVNPDDQRDEYILGRFSRRDEALASERRWVEDLLKGLL